MPRTWKFAIVGEGEKFKWTLTVKDDDAEGQTTFKSDKTFANQTKAQEDIGKIKKADVDKEKGKQ